MKKPAAALSLTLLSLSMIPGTALATNVGVVEQAIGSLGGISADQNGNMNLSKEITRGEFAKMLVEVSPYADSVVTYGYSAFPDVRSDNPYVGYIRTAVQNGLMKGYLDGTFRPDAKMSFEQGATYALNLLGWNSSNLYGVYPSAQIAKFNELDLQTDLSLKKGDTLTRNDAMYMFYNLLSAKTTKGTVYGNDLGFSLNESDQVNIHDVITSETGTAFVYSEGSIPDNATVYIEGKLASVGEITPYGICYYNKNSNTVWVYTSSVSGRVTDISSVEDPQTVTISGTTYSLETNDAASAFSSLGQFSEGDLVTVLLGRDGAIAAAIDPGSSDSHELGVVTASSINEYVIGGQHEVSYTYSVMLVDGSTKVYETENRMLHVDDIVEITFDNNRINLDHVDVKNKSGKINASGTTFGGTKIAAGVQMLEMYDGTYGVLYPQRIANTYIDEDSVLYYTENSEDEIDKIIFKNVTGDLCTYGYITDSFTSSERAAGNPYFTYVSNGATLPGTINPDYDDDEKNVTDKYDNEWGGGARFEYNDDGTLDSVDALKKLDVDKITTFGIKSDDDGTFGIADDVQVYLQSNDYYASDDFFTLVSLSSVNDLNNYKLVAYYDNFGYSAGKKVRVIVAQKLDI